DSLFTRIASHLPWDKLVPIGRPKPAPCDYEFLTEARGKVSLMPREIVAKQSSKAREIIVSWEDGETQYFSKLFGKAIQYHITLHNAGCWGETTRLLHPSGESIARYHM